MNARYYIGIHSTNMDPSKGWDEYFASGKVINAAKDKYGENAFKREILAVYDTRDEVEQAERKWLSFYLDDPECYNIADGGQGGPGWIKTFELWRKRDPESYYEHVQNAGKKISLANKGRIVTDETKRRISKSLKGREVSEETKRKISNSNKGKKFSVGHLANLKEGARRRFADPQKRQEAMKALSTAKLSKKEITRNYNRALGKRTKLLKKFKNPYNAKEFQIHQRTVDFYHKQLTQIEINERNIHF